MNPYRVEAYYPNAYSDALGNWRCWGTFPNRDAAREALARDGVTGRRYRIVDRFTGTTVQEWRRDPPA